MSNAKPSVLFLCVHNAGRSQMAAGWMRYLADGAVDVFSGGSEPANEVNPAAVEAMREAGVDIASAEPHRWTDSEVQAADVVVTMGCGDSCPVFPGKRYLDWELDDPAGKGVEDVRPVRDEIESRVRGLLAELVPSSESGELIVYGTDWCSDCFRTKAILDSRGVSYEWIDLGEHPESIPEVTGRNSGMKVVPTLVFPDGRSISEPTESELLEMLGLA